MVGKTTELSEADGLFFEDNIVVRADVTLASTLTLKIEINNGL